MHNPFMFFMQCFATLLLLEAGCAEQQSSSHPTQLIDATLPHVPTMPAILSQNDSWKDHPKSATVIAGAYHSATLVADWAWRTTKPGSEHRLAHGHGSIAGIRMHNPFMFFMQCFATLLLLEAGCAEQQSSSHPTQLIDATLPHVPTMPAILSQNDSWKDHPKSATVIAGAYHSATLVADWAWRTTKPGSEHRLAHGHGSIAGIRMHNPFMFFMQVRKRYGKCIRSNNVCLIVLPCPWLLCSLFWDLAFCVKELLLLGGDIETNPGPDLESISKQLELIALDLKDIKEQRLKSIETKLESLALLDKKVSSCIDQVAHLQTTVRTLELKIDDLENQSRRSNLLVFGVPESEKENSASLDKLINDTIITDILKCSPVSIERIHRLGKPTPNKHEAV
ncbi:uncharacterized protein LOC144143356 [Haemaphysalis longicornis]